MDRDAVDRSTPPRGLGALLHTDTEYVELGEHRGRRLRARVEHRTIRLAFGQPGSNGLTLGRRRPVAVEVTPADPAIVPIDRGRTVSGTPSGASYDVPVTAPPDPWPRTARRLALLALAGWIVMRLARRSRRNEGDLP